MVRPPFFIYENLLSNVLTIRMIPFTIQKVAFQGLKEALSGGERCSFRG